MERRRNGAQASRVIKPVIVRSRFVGRWGRKDPDRHHELTDTTTHVSGRSGGAPSPVCRSAVLVSQVQAGKRASAPRELSNGWSRCRRCLRRDEGRESPVRFRSRPFQPQHGEESPSSGMSPTSRESATPSTKGTSRTRRGSERVRRDASPRNDAPRSSRTKLAPANSSATHPRFSQRELCWAPGRFPHRTKSRG